MQSRPVWIDDPHFNARYHVRHTALPAPAGEEELRRLAGRVFAQGLDRSKPLWELWLVDRVGEGSFALISKTHHALVDGVSGVDISTVLFDLELDARMRKGIAQPSKTGWVYVLDRTDGTPLIGIDERPVPQEPRQATSATQPFPRGDAFVPQSISIAPEGLTGDPVAPPEPLHQVLCHQRHQRQEHQ